MSYFPTEQDWSQAVQPSRIPTDKCFLGKFMVNSLPIYGTKQSKAGLQDLRGKGKGKAPPPQNAPKHRLRPAARPNRSYPNTILVDRDARQTHTKPDKGAAQDPSEQPRWLEEAKEHLSRIYTNDEDFALEATSQV